MRLLFILSEMLFALCVKADVITWEYNHTSWTRADAQSEWIPATQFNVYHSRHGDGWQFIGTTRNQTFTVTNRGWYAVEAALGTNRSEFATCAFNPFAIVRVNKLTIVK